MATYAMPRNLKQQLQNYQKTIRVYSKLFSFHYQTQHLLHALTTQANEFFLRGFMGHLFLSESSLVTELINRYFYSYNAPILPLLSSICLNIVDRKIQTNCKYHSLYPPATPLLYCGNTPCHRTLPPVSNTTPLPTSTLHHFSATRPMTYADNTKEIFRELFLEIFLRDIVRKDQTLFQQ